MKRFILLLFLSTLMAIIAACGTNEHGNDAEKGNVTTNDSEEDTQEVSAGEQNEQVAASSQEIKVDMQNSNQQSVGTATLEAVEGGVKVTLNGKNLPKGTHAFHIHETGKCDPPDFESAGGHFNPDNTKHGFDSPEGPHAGDMPNIAVGEDGTVHQSFLVQNVSLAEKGDHSLLAGDGTSLVIHEGADDGKSQPAGDAGPRLACGVISK